MADLTYLFGGKAFDLPAIEQRTPEEQLKDAMHNAGIIPPNNIIFDGKLRRFFSSRNRKKGKTGWYVVFSDGVPAGQFGCWRSGIQISWRADIGRKMTDEEIRQNELRFEEARIQREKEKQQQSEKAQKEISEIWQNAQAASEDHPYLAKKQINPNGARVGRDGRLILPIYRSDGTLSSLQYIDNAGGKLYHKGGKVSACFWMLGNLEEPGPVYIAEGFATSATIHEVTGRPVFISYSASNLVPTTGIIRDLLGDSRQLTIIADNDESGVGLRYAEQAAAKYGASVVMVPNKGDANDFVIDGGDLISILQVELNDWLVPLSDFCKKPVPIKWLVRDWVQAKSLVMVHGPSGGGKTFLVLDWCMRMACGCENWIDKKVMGGVVVYLAGEGHHGLKNRSVAWLQENGKDDGNIYFSRDGTEINTPKGYLKVLENIRAMKVKPDLIVVDTLHRFLEGDENLSKDAKTMIDACNQLMRCFDCSVLLVHHTGVSVDAQHRARGSSAWRGALDIEISMQPSKGSIQVKQVKAKDSEIAKTVFVELKKIEINGWFDDDGEPVSSCVVVETEEPTRDSGSKVIKEISIIQSAWEASGREFLEGLPYITKSALKDFLTTTLKKANGEPYTKKSIDNMIFDDTKLVGKLVSNLIIEKTENGWKVIDELTISQWSLSMPQNTPRDTPEVK